MAHDETTVTELLELKLLLEAVFATHGYDFREYATASLLRRIRQVVHYEGVETITGLQNLVLHQAGAVERLVAAVTVATTTMFRDPDFYLALRTKVLPVLRTYPHVRIWHAGCATGEEVYSMAILLEEEGLYERATLYGTDISTRGLASARAGTFPLRQMRDNTTNYHQAGGRKDFSNYYTADAQQATFKESIRRNLFFAEHNLVSDGRFNEFHLILCRNVLIYFNSSLRDKVHQLFLDSLVRFGMLGLGSSESIKFSAAQASYRPLGPGMLLYKRTY